MNKRQKIRKQGFAYKNTSSLFSSFNCEEIIGTTELFYNIFRKNTDVKSAITKLQSTTWRSGFFIEKNGEKIEENIFINIFKNIRSLKSDIIRDLVVWGSAFVLAVKNPFGQVVELQTLDPRSVKIIANKYGEVIKYIQRVWMEVQEYEPEEIYQLTEIKDPDNEILGLSKIETLLYDVMWDDEAMKSNYAFFKNNAIPNTILILEDNMTDEEYSSAMKQFKTQFSGGINRHKVSTNTGIKDIRTIGQSHKDMEFIAQRQFTTEKVCSALGVPKTLLGYHNEVNFSTSDNGYRIFIEETIRPLEDLLAGFFTNILRNEFGDEEIRFYFIDDRDFDRTAKIDEYIKMLNNGLITIDEIRTEMGYEVFWIEATQKPIIKQGFEFVEDIGTTELLNENQAPME